MRFSSKSETQPQPVRQSEQRRRRERDQQEHRRDDQRPPAQRSPPETSGHSAMIRNTTVNTQPKRAIARRLDVVGSGKILVGCHRTKSTWSIAITPSTLSADHHVEPTVATTGQQHFQFGTEAGKRACRRPGAKQRRPIRELLTRRSEGWKTAARCRRDRTNRLTSLIE